MGFKGLQCTCSVFWNRTSICIVWRWGCLLVDGDTLRIGWMRKGRKGDQGQYLLYDWHNIITRMSGNAADLLLALNNQVKHESSEEPKAKPVINNTKKGPIIESKHLEVGKQSPMDTEPAEPTFKQNMMEEETFQPPECLVQILTRQVGTQISEGLSQLVESTLKQRQKNTYLSLTGSSPTSHIQAMLGNARKKNESNLSLIASCMQARASKVEGDVFSGQLPIIPEINISTKKQLEFIAKLDLARMIKIKEGELRNKMDVLNEKISNLEEVENWNGVNQDQMRIEREVERRLAEGLDSNTYALDSDKTKIASEYVRHMHRQRRLFEKRKNERDGRYAQHEGERESELQEAMQMKDLAKRQEIIERIEQRRKRREDQEQVVESKEKEVHSFLAVFHSKKPLFKQKEKEFQEKFVKPEERLREERLNEIRDNRRSLSFNEIRSHEESYISNLKSVRVKRDEEFKLILKSRKTEGEVKAYYKGSAHKRMNQMTKQTEKRHQSVTEASKLKALRMREYSEVIHDKYKPQVDEKKKEELMRYIEVDMLRKKRAKKVYKQVVDETTNQVKMVSHYEPLPERDYRSEGKKLFEQSKKVPRKKETQSEHDREEELKLNGQSPNSVRLLRGPPVELESQLKDIWSARQKQLKEFAALELVDAKNFEFVKHNIDNLDKKAELRESVINKLNLSMDEHMKSKGMLDQFYVQSIKEKIKLME